MSHTITVAVCFRVISIVFKLISYKIDINKKKSHLAKTDTFVIQQTTLINPIFHVGILSEKLIDLTITCLKWIPE